MPPKSGYEYDLASEVRPRPFWHRFWEGQASIFRNLWMVFSNFLAYFGYVFGCSYAPPDPPAPDLVFVILGQFVSQFAKRIQELAEDKAENEIPTESQETSDHKV